MRVVGTLVFALVFLVNCIVCPRVENPDPPYRVARMSAAQLPGVLTQYDTTWMKSLGRVVRDSKEYYPVVDDLYVVKQGDRIIGRTDIRGILDPIAAFFASGRQLITYNFRMRIDDPRVRIERMWPEDQERLGINHPLPANTIYEDVPEPQRRRIIYKKQSNGAVINIVYRPHYTYQ